MDSQWPPGPGWTRITNGWQHEDGRRISDWFRREADVAVIDLSSLQGLKLTAVTFRERAGRSANSCCFKVSGGPIVDVHLQESKGRRRLTGVIAIGDQPAFEVARQRTDGALLWGTPGVGSDHTQAAASAQPGVGRLRPGLARIE